MALHAVALAWLQAPSPTGVALPLDEALRRLHQEAAPDTADAERSVQLLGKVARSEAIERLKGGRAA